MGHPIILPLTRVMGIQLLLEVRGDIRRLPVTRSTKGVLFYRNCGAASVEEYNR